MPACKLLIFELGTLEKNLYGAKYLEKLS